MDFGNRICDEIKKKALQEMNLAGLFYKSIISYLINVTSPEYSLVLPSMNVTFA